MALKEETINQEGTLFKPALNPTSEALTRDRPVDVVSRLMDSLAGKYLKNMSMLE